MSTNTAIQFPKGCYVGSKIKERIFDNIITSETVFSAGACSDWHYHSNSHFSHILSGGSTELRVSDSEKQFEGKGLYYFPGIPHQNISYQAGTRIFNVEIEDDFFRIYNLQRPSEALMYDGNVALNAGGLIKILKEHLLDDKDSVISVDQLCINLIETAHKVEDNNPAWTNKIRVILNDCWNISQTLTELAGNVEIHPVTLSKYFRKYFNCTLGEYRRRIKIERALQLIRKSKYSLTEIAYQCDFTDQAHFTKTFLNITGLLPSQYKKL
ncbi:MAG: transcriptional regulator, AraC family [Mucilaginibacter sp.]|nr:transcriptional regulator, AraC family [Mucilaginibacter sp.]